MPSDDIGGRDPHEALGGYLTAYEAGQLALAFAAGQTTMTAVDGVPSSRRTHIRELLDAAGIHHSRRDASVAILRAIAGARSVETTVTPVWTMPGSEATSGRLTREAQRIIDSARMSVVCATFNFSAGTWKSAALAAASERPGVSVAVYVDGRTGGAQKVADMLPLASVYRTKTMRPGRKQRFVSHAKFIVVDRALMLVTSANFSYPAENRNVELGLLIEDSALAASVEDLMRDKRGVLYELVPPS
ncbi:DISARM system phospholipase D-like protein DrmC [Cryptosporangium japonicum]|uniref:phospholipase D n=1 Tax=Cryptosporangium japonicum TaxID=80872 RepID=A0ABP3EJC1_9ACTN